jgi:hypothetical protein
MTAARIEAWLAARVPNRPAALAERMSSLVAACPADALAADASMAAAMGTLGTFAVSRVNETTDATPDLALELLAADAFVTYAFEAAAEESVDVMSLALRLLRAA